MDPIRHVPVVNLDALNRAAEKYRHQLDNNPDDMDSRVQLAWCLFLLAMFGTTTEKGLPKAHVESSLTAWDAEKALNDCLRETFMVIQLSTDKEDHIRVKTLQSLVKLLCGTQILSHAEQEATSVLTQLIQEILAEDSENKPLAS